MVSIIWSKYFPSLQMTGFILKFRLVLANNELQLGLEVRNISYLQPLLSRLHLESAQDRAGPIWEWLVICNDIHDS